MGVLDPLLRNSSETIRVSEEVLEMIDLTIRSLKYNEDALLANREDMLRDDAFFFRPLSDKDIPFHLSSKEEINKRIRELEGYKEDEKEMIKMSKVAKKYAEKKDIEPDHENPFESFAALDKLERNIEGFPSRLENNLGMNEGIDRVDYAIIEGLMSLADGFDAFPVIEGVVESEELIKEEKEDLLKATVEEYNRPDTDHYRIELPKEPVDWEKVIEEEQLNIDEYLNVDGIIGATRGDSLHLMMENSIGDLEGIRSEYPLHFTDLSPVDDTLRPDAIDSLFVYEFKHLPFKLSRELEEEGEMSYDNKSIENMGQVNNYLNQTGLPVGMLVYISSDMNVHEYVIEKHQTTNKENYLREFRREDYGERFVHKRDEYDFDGILDKLD